MEVLAFMYCLTFFFFGSSWPFDLSSSSWLEELLPEVTLLSETLGSATGSLSIVACFSAVSHDYDESELVPIVSSSLTALFSCPLLL